VNADRDKGTRKMGCEKSRWDCVIEDMKQCAMRKLERMEGDEE